MGLSIAAFPVSVVAAWGTWEQVRVSREAIFETLTVVEKGAVMLLPDGSYLLFSGGNRLRDPVEGERLMLYAEIVNVGRADGLITEATLPTNASRSPGTLGYEELECSRGEIEGWGWDPRPAEDGSGMPRGDQAKKEAWDENCQLPLA